MTLVVSDISKHGIAMVGDSAVTFLGPPKTALPNASKIFYCDRANVGVQRHFPLRTPDENVAGQRKYLLD